ncbi:MAG: molybdopterin-dependent oxidoreductase [Oceanospirillaceae bacterium]|nr:molybdopterin-dependent oxidoreductase [Oceanospirillaceae bacterium]MCP5349461.1 molybdopterin-dependent oxidoreductase [Oceanospirillaceae bacterium]
MPSDIKTHYRTCNLCEAMCGLEISHQGGKILQIKGDKQDVFSRGHICPKAIALQDLHEDPDRLRTPLKRQGNEWLPISWDAAFREIGAKIKDIQRQQGNDAVAAYLGNPNVHNYGNMLLGKKLWQALGSRNLFSATSVDQLPHHIVSHLLFGHQLQIPVPDIDHTDYFFIIGANPMASNGSIMSVPDIKNRLKAITARGGKIVVLDPRRTETAELATEHHFIKPASDALFLLAFCHVLVNEKQLHTQKDLLPCHGLHDLPELFADFSPEMIAASTGIPANNIRRLCNEFIAAPSAVMYGRMGVSVQKAGTLCQYLIMLCNILCKRLDQTGGLMFANPAVNLLPHSGRGSMGKHFTRVRKLAGFGGELPVSALAEEILTPGTGQIKALFSVAGNPVLSTPNGQQLDKALASLDYMVAIDMYITETSRHAHIILPPSSPLERDHYDVVFHNLAVRNTAKYSPALFNKDKNTQHDWQIFLRLAKTLRPAKKISARITQQLMLRNGPRLLLASLLRFGPHGRGFKAGGLSLRKLQKEPHGIDLGPLKPCLPKALHHKDKHIHLRPDFFQSAISECKTWLTHNPDELLLIGRRHVRNNNSWLHNSQRLIKGKNRCTAQLHSQTAAIFNIHNGAHIKVSSRVGNVQIEAQISDDIMPGVISIPHGFGHHAGSGWQIAREHAGVSANDLTDEQNTDPLSGNAVLNGVPVTISPLSA